MSFLSDQIIIKNSTLVWIGLMYLVNKYIEKKYRINLPDSDFGKIDLLTDRVVDNAIKQEKKLSLLWRRIRGKPEPVVEVEPIPQNSQTVPGPNTISDMDYVKDHVANLENDFGIMLPLFNKELEHFKEEIEKMLETTNCSPEVKDECIKHFLRIKKAFNGNIGS